MSLKLICIISIFYWFLVFIYLTFPVEVEWVIFVFLRFLLTEDILGSWKQNLHLHFFSLPLTWVELMQIYTSSDLPASSGSLWRHCLCILRSALCGLLASTVFSFLVLEVELAGLICKRILAWKIPWTKEPGGLWSMGSQRVRHD